MAVVVGTTLVVALGVGAWATSVSYERQLMNETFRGLHRLGDTLRRSLRHAMLETDRDALAVMVDDVGAQEGIEGIRLYNKDGRVVVSSRHDELLKRVDTSDTACRACHASGRPPSALSPEELANVYTDASGQRRFQIIEPVYNEPACSTAGCHPGGQAVLGVMGLTVPLARIDGQLADHRARIWAWSLVAIAVVCAVVLLTLRRLVSRRLRGLVEGTRLVASGNLEHRIADLGDDELGALAASFNRMTETLQETRGQLLQSERLASLGRLSAGLAHEINNPLTGVLLCGSTVLDGMAADDPRREHLQVVVQETTRCRDIIRSLLDFARQRAPQKAAARLAEVVDRAVRIVRNQAALGHIEIQYAPPAECTVPPLYVDAGQIQQVVLNLLLNAVDAMSEGGVITVSCSVVEGGFAELRVTDTGEGIPPENLSRLFEPFFSTRGAKGNGLGLAVSWGIVEQHGGTLRVESVVGKGTTFFVRLPLAHGSTT
jgi:two-component system NtrC family sensor kinase